MANYHETAQEIKNIAKQYLPTGKFNQLSNKLDKIIGGIKRGANRRPPAAVESVFFDDTPLFVETQEQAVLRHLQAGETLDGMDGLNMKDISSMQLRTIICRLRKKGWNIADRRILSPKGKRCKEYWLVEDEEETQTN